MPGPCGAIAQLGERLLCKQEVVGSIPSGSTSRGLRLVRREHLSASVIGREASCGRVISDIVKRRIAPRVERVAKIMGDAHLRASWRDRMCTRGVYVGCLTARRRNDPKQAGLSNQCPTGRFAVRTQVLRAIARAAAERDGH